MSAATHLLTVVVVGYRGPFVYAQVPYSKERRAELRRMVAHDPRPASLYETYRYNSWLNLRNAVPRCPTAST